MRNRNGRSPVRGTRNTMWILLGACAVSAGTSAAGPGETAGPRIEAYLARGHGDGVEAIAFSPDGRLLATGGSDQTIKLWDVANGSELRTLRGHTGKIKLLAFIEGGRILASGGSDSVVSFWDPHSGRKRGAHDVGPRYLDLNVGDSESMTISPDGRRIVVSGRNEVTPWDLRTMKKERTFEPHADHITQVALSPDGRKIATSSWDMTVRISEVGSGQTLLVLRGHTEWIRSVAFSPDGRYVASVSDDTTARLWEAETGRELASFTGPPDILTQAVEPLRVVQFSPSGDWLAAGGVSGNVIIYDVPARKTIRTLRAQPWLAKQFDFRPGTGHTGEVSSLAFSPDGQLLATGGQDTTVRLWHLSTGQEVEALTGKARPSTIVAFTPDGCRLAVAGNRQPITWWDLSEGAPVKELPVNVIGTDLLAFSPDGRRMALAGIETLLWDISASREILLLRHKSASEFAVEERPVSVGFNSAGDLFATVSGFSTKSSRLVIRRASDGGNVTTLNVPGTGSAAFAFSPDSSLLATISVHPDVKIWDPRASNPSPGIKEGPSTISSRSAEWMKANGRQLLGQLFGTFKGSLLKLWDTATWRELKTLPVDELMPQAIFFTPDGTKLFAVGAWGVRVIDLASWCQVKELQGCRGPAALSHDGKYLATRCDAGIKLWNMSTAQEAHTLIGHASEVTSLAFHPRQHLLASTSDDCTVKLWNADDGRLVATFFSRADGGWVSLLPDHYYRCSPGGLDALSFQTDSQVYAAEQFDLLFNRPDLVMERLGCTDRQLVDIARQERKRRLERMAVSEANLHLDLETPRVAIDRGPLPRITSDDRVVLRVKASDDRSNLKRLAVSVNGVPIVSDIEGGGLAVRGRELRQFEAEIPVELSSGMNRIHVSAFNERGIASPREEVRIERTARPTRPDLWIVAIGVSRYQDRSFDLPLAAKDAEDIAAIAGRGPLSGDIGRRFNQVHTVVLTDEKATRDNILRTKKELAQSKVDDMVIVFVSGHGMLDSRLNYLFGTYEVNFDNPVQGGLSFDELHGLLGGIPARMKLLLLDTCHAGEVDGQPGEQAASGAFRARNVRRSSNDLDVTIRVRSLPAMRGVGGIRSRRPLLSLATLSREIRFVDLRRETGASVIAACSGQELSVEDDRLKNGVFTYALLECLRTSGGDRDADGKIRVSELLDFVAPRVGELTGGSQLPSERRENPLNDFVVFENKPLEFNIAPSDSYSATISVVLSADRKSLLAGHTRGIVDLWDMRSGRLLQRIEGVGGRIAFAEISDKDLLMHTYDGRTLSMWDVRSGRKLWESAVVKGMTVPTGGGIVAVLNDQAAAPRLLDWRSGRELRRFISQNSSASISNMAVNADRLITGREDGGVAIFELSSGSVLANFRAPGPVHGLVIAAKSGRALVVGVDTVTLWDANQATLVKSLGPTPKPVRYLVSIAGKRILMGGTDPGPFQLFDATSGALVSVIHGDPASAPAFSGNGRRLLTGGTTPGSLHLFNATSGSLVSVLAADSGRLFVRSYSPDSKWIVTVHEDGVARIWDAANGKLLRRLTGHRGTVSVAAFTTDSRRIVTIDGDECVRIWNVTDSSND